MNSRPVISIIIPTYNRASLVCNILGDLLAQVGEDPRFEVIVVDNNSPDDTAIRVADYSRASNIRYVLEKIIGLSYARNRGWRYASGEYIAYIDDDCRVPAEWPTNVLHVIQEEAPLIFGGPYYAFYDTPKPDWFKDEYQSHVQGSFARFLLNNETLDGANIIIRRDILETLGGFDPRLGMSGNKLGYGDETALQYHFRNRYPEAGIYYVPNLFIYHLVPPRKWTWRWNIRQRFADGRFYERTTTKPRGIVQRVKAIVLIPGYVVALMLDLAKGFLRNREKYPYLQNYLFEYVLRRIFTIGALYERAVRVALTRGS